jgi:hypothetical protein
MTAPVLKIHILLSDLWQLDCRWRLGGDRFYKNDLLCLGRDRNAILELDLSQLRCEHRRARQFPFGWHNATTAQKIRSQHQRRLVTRRNHNRHLKHFNGLGHKHFKINVFLISLIYL